MKDEARNMRRIRFIFRILYLRCEYLPDYIITFSMSMLRFFTLISCFIFVLSCDRGRSKIVPTGTTYEDLSSLFLEWRASQQPPAPNGFPDYSPAAMNELWDKLGIWKARLDAIDTTGWPVKDQVDWFLVWAEMNGTDFEHRVTRPWANDPAFYVWFHPGPSDVPEREGPNPVGYIELSTYRFPLDSLAAGELARKFTAMKPLYNQARENLTGNGRDLWRLSVRSIRQQGADIQAFASSVRREHPRLAEVAMEAKKESDLFADWIQGKVKAKTGVSGVGKENYDWYIQKVHLMPYDHDSYRQLLERELMRSHAALRLTEHRNRELAPLAKVSDPVAFDTMMQRGLREFMQLLADRVMTVKDYMAPAMQAQIGTFTPSDSIRGFFAEVDYRDPMPMRSHHFHWIDKAMQKNEPVASPIRREPLMHNIFDSRAEGLATAMEELMWQSGLYRNRPRAEELVWIMLAQRAARGLAGLNQHVQEMDFDGATRFASQWVPRGLLPAGGETIQAEEHFYLQQPGYETSYVSGKLQIDKLIAEYGRQREGRFDMKQFMDEFLAKGIIPMSLIYWEMTGDRSMVNAATGQ
jgi:hypothetical protein